MISDRFAFEAGRIAQRLGWGEVELIELADLHSMGPSGSPLMVLSTTEMNVQDARTVAALHAAGRKVTALCDEPPTPDALKWLPAGAVQVLPRYRQVSVPSKEPALSEPSREREPRDLGLWRRLVRDESNYVRQLVAQSPQCPLTFLSDLARDADPHVRAAIAGSPRLSEDLLLGLALDSDPYVVRGVLASGRLPSEWHDSLSQRPEGRLFRAETSTNPEELGDLANDTDPAVRGAVAWNRSVSPATLVRLADDDEVEVRAACILNPNTPETTSIRLARAAIQSDELLFGALDERIQWDFGTEIRPNVGVALMDMDDYFAQLLMPESWVPADRVSRATLSHDRVLRGAAAGSPHCSPARLRGLGRDPDAFVRFKTAENPLTPADILNELAADVEGFGLTRNGYGESKGFVFFGVCTNPAAPPSVLREAFNTAKAQWSSPQTDFGWIYTELATHQNSSSDLLDEVLESARRSEIAEPVMAAVAAHPNAGPSALEELAASDYPRVQLALLEREDLPEECLAILLNH